MSNYVIVHDPHSSPVLVDNHKLIVDATREIEIVTDWHVSELIEGDETVSFPFSRLCCDVERLRPDPAEERGQGVLYTRAIDGSRLRNDPTPQDLLNAHKLWDEHHSRLDEVIERAISWMKVVLIDAHSFSDLQAAKTGIEPFSVPDICLGYNGERPVVVDDLADLFRSHGLTVAFNSPFAGSLLPKRFERHCGLVSIMIEINKRLYLEDVTRPKRHPEGFARLKGIMASVLPLLTEQAVRDVA